MKIRYDPDERRWDESDPSQRRIPSSLRHEQPSRELRNTENLLIPHKSRAQYPFLTSCSGIRRELVGYFLTFAMVYNSLCGRDIGRFDNLKYVSSRSGLKGPHKSPDPWKWEEISSRDGSKMYGRRLSIFLKVTSQILWPYPQEALVLSLKEGKTGIKVPGSSSRTDNATFRALSVVFLASGSQLAPLGSNVPDEASWKENNR